MSPEDIEHIVSSLESIATIIALAVGGYWTYRRFVKQREDFALIDFTVDINFIGEQDGSWIVELIAHLENKGKVRHWFSDLNFDLAALFQSDQLQAKEEMYGGQAIFPNEIEKRPWIPNGRYFIEPGLRNKYSFVARVPKEASFLILHGRFTYENQAASHTAERTAAVPTGPDAGNNSRSANHTVRRQEDQNQGVARSTAPIKHSSRSARSTSDRTPRLNSARSSSNRASSGPSNRLAIGPRSW